MSSRAGMARGAKAYIAGHRGLLGSALVRCLRAAGFENLVTLAHAELDLADAAAAFVFVMGLPDETFDSLLHAGSAARPSSTSAAGRTSLIRELAELVRSVVGCRAEIRWDADKPDGTPRKLLDVSRLQALGWRPRIGLREGLGRAYGWFSGLVCRAHHTAESAGPGRAGRNARWLSKARARPTRAPT